MSRRGQVTEVTVIQFDHERVFKAILAGLSGISRADAKFHMGVQGPIGPFKILLTRVAAKGPDVICKLWGALCVLFYIGNLMQFDII